MIEKAIDLPGSEVGCIKVAGSFQNGLVFQHDSHTH